MKCPKCQRNNDKVYRGYDKDYSHIRYRKCLSCGYRFKSVERLDYKTMGSNCFCSECKEPLYPEDDYFDLDGQMLCENCAKEWLSLHKGTVTEEQAYGGEDV